MAHRVLVFALCVAMGPGLGACAGSGAGLDSNGRPTGSEGGGGALTADFQSIQDNVFTPICSVCHAGGAAPQGLRLDAVNSYSMIVGVPSTEDPSVLRIKPGNPDNSYLVQKIEGHASVGAQMPFGGPPLPAATINVIRQWVTDGALQASAIAPATGLAIVAAAPATGEVVLESPPRVIVTFNRELDRSQLGPSLVQIERVVADGGGMRLEIPVDVAVPTGNPFALLIAPRVRLGDGRYRVVVSGSAGLHLTDIAGNRLGAEGERISLTEFTVEANP